MKSNHLVEIHEFLHNNTTFSSVVSGLRKKSPQKISSNKSSFGFIISTLSKLLKVPSVVITSNPEESIEILDSINFWSTSTSNLNFTERNEIFLEKYKPDNKSVKDRMRCLEALFTDKFQNKTPIICTSIQSLSTKTLSRDNFENLSINLQIGNKINQKDFIDSLIKAGYKNSSIVESVGQFAKRGDIVDLFCLSEQNPVRIDFFYDEIESIKILKRFLFLQFKKLLFFKT